MMMTVQQVAHTFAAGGGVGIHQDLMIKILYRECLSEWSMKRWLNPRDEDKKVDLS